MDVDVKEFNARKAQVAELQAKLAAPADITLDRTALNAGLVMVREFKDGTVMIDDPSKDYIEFKPGMPKGPLAVAQDPAGVRSALRKLGVEKIVATPVEDGWQFEGICNLSRIITGVSAPPSPPRAEAPRRNRGALRLR